MLPGNFLESFCELTFLYTLTQFVHRITYFNFCTGFSALKMTLGNLRITKGLISQTVSNGIFQKDLPQTNPDFFWKLSCSFFEIYIFLPEFQPVFLFPHAVSLRIPSGVFFGIYRWLLSENSHTGFFRSSDKSAFRNAYRNLTLDLEVLQTCSTRQRFSEDLLGCFLYGIPWKESEEFSRDFL